MNKKIKTEAVMRAAFEAWAQQEGWLTRRRDDKPELYLISETQRRWLIWREAYFQGHAAGLSTCRSATVSATALPSM